MTLTASFLFVLLSTFHVLNRCQNDKSAAQSQTDVHTLLDSVHDDVTDRFGYICTIHTCQTEEFLCYGVLVHAEMLLTAHYCFDGLGKEYEKNDIVVKCGTRSTESVSPKTCITDIRRNSLQDGSDNSEQNGLALVHLADAMEIELPNVAQPYTQHDSGTNLQVLFWRPATFEETESDVGIYTLTSEEKGKCSSLQMETDVLQDYLCMSKENGNSCEKNVKGEMPQGGNARPLVKTGPTSSIGEGRNRLDLIYGIEAKVSIPCTSEDVQEELFIPIFNHTSWIQDELDELEDPVGSTESLLIDEDALFECLLYCPPDTPPSQPSEISPDTCKSEGDLDCTELLEDGTLASAIAKDRVADIERYMQCSEKCNLKSKDALLHLSAEFDSSRIAKILLDAGADVNGIDAKGFTPLHYAAQNNSIKTLQVLLEESPDLSPVTEPKQITPLHLAARHGHTSIISYLVDKGVNVDARNADLDSPLHLACAYGHVSAAKALLDADAVCAVRNYLNWTPRDVICQRAADCTAAIVINLENLFDPECG